MRLLFIVMLGVLASRSGRAQERVRNVRIRVLDSAQVEIRYDLINARPGDSVYVAVRSRVRGTLRIRPEFVQGDVGMGLPAGSDRRIIWNALANGYNLNEEIQAIVRLKTGVAPAPAVAAAKPPVATRPAPTTKSRTDAPTPPEPVRPTRPDSVATSTSVAEQPRPDQTEPSAPVRPEATPGLATESTQPQSVRRRYDGPAWALLSVVAPGVGNIFVQQPKPRVGFRTLVTAVTYGLLAYGLQERRQSQNAYAQYEQQKNEAAGEPFYQSANQHHQRYYLATRAAAAVVLTDVVLTFIKGMRNSQRRRQTRPSDAISVRPGVQMGQPTAVLRYSF